MNYFLLFLALIAVPASSWAQFKTCDNIAWGNSNQSGAHLYNDRAIELPNTIHRKVNYSIDETRVQVRLALEEDGVFPYGKGDDFDLVIDFSANIRRINGTGGATINATMQLSETQPEAIYEVVLNDVAALESNDPYNLGNSTLLYVVENITITHNYIPNVVPPAWMDLVNNIQFSICYEMDIRSDVGATNNGYFPVASNLLGLATQPVGMPYYNFEWEAERAVAGFLDPSTYVPHYEFQLLKLENTLLDAANRTDEQHIKTVVDWEKALSFVLPEEKLRYNGHYRLLLKPSEGQGYYLWRVRPLGNYFEGGVAQNQNWGNWSAPLYTLSNGTLELRAPSSMDCFYYRNQDEHDNYLYNRLFTEDGQVYESMTYADKLLRPHQSQTYLPSENSSSTGQTVVGQTLYDHLGRSSISVIPVPVEGYMNGYKEKFVQNNTGDLYQLEDYGTDDKLYDPSKVSTSGPYQYYSDDNTQDVTVPDAEGYPFTRTIYSNDGLNRVREQSGIGKTHMVGPRSNGRGRTTTTDVQVGVTDAELVSIFGLEAPHPDHVVKQVVTDPNGTNAVTYTSKSGKTLATALAEPYEPNSGTYPLLPLDASKNNTLRINEVMGLGNYKKNSFVNSKTILLTQFTSTLDITYQAPGCAGGGDSLPACLVDNFSNCTYFVELTVTGAANGTNVGQTSYTFTDTLTVSGCAPYTLATLTNLPAGSYTVKKRVYPADNGLSTLISDYQRMVEAQMSRYMALIDLLLDQVRQPSDWLTIDLAVTDVNVYLNTNRDAAAQATLATALNGHFNDAFLTFDFTTLQAATGGFGEVVLALVYDTGLDATQTGLAGQTFDQILLVVQNIFR